MRIPSSLSLLRHHHSPPSHLSSSFSTALLSRPIFTFAFHRLLLHPVSAKQGRPHQGRGGLPRRFQQPSKHAFKNRDAFLKHFSTLSPTLSPNNNNNRPTLSPDQAIGMVASAQANFMRVIVQLPPPPLADEGSLSAEEVDVPKESNGGVGRRVGVELLCGVKAVLKKIGRRVLVGDKVLVDRVDWVDRRGMITDVFERKSEIADPPVANVDHFLVLFSLDQPKIEPFSLTRFLIEAESSGIPLSLALNKIELVDEEVAFGWRAKIRSWGYEPILCSVELNQGLDTLAFTLRDRRTVIVGPSGVGKSSLINALRSCDNSSAAVEEDDSDIILGGKWYEEQQVGEVSARSGRGKHTTRHVSLLPLAGGGYLADTPGFNQPSLMKVTKQSLAHSFPEIQKMLEESEPKKCSFNDCLHVGEPGCVVKGDWERYPFYLQLLDEIKIREEFQLRTLGTKRESDVRIKVGDGGVLHAEPRLELKKHRRQSRRSLNQAIADEIEELYDEDDDVENPILQAIEEENK